MSYNPNNPNGSTTAANSSPVTVATDNNIAKETGGNLATIVTNTGNIPAKGANTKANSTPVTMASDQTAIPISAASLPLPTGASTDGTDITTPTAMPAGGAGIRGWLSAIWTKLNGTLAVTGTFWQATQPISAASLPLPTGAAQDATLTGGTVRTKITDGTNNAAVKAASTAAAATDPAVVVAISPNNTVPVSLATNTPVLAAGSAIVGKVGIDQTTAGTTNAISLAFLGSVAVSTGTGASGTGVQRNVLTNDYLSTVSTHQNISTTSSGLLIAKVLSAANTTPVQVKTAAGQLYGYHLFNNSSTTRFVRVFNVASAPTMGTTSPTLVLPIPAGGGAVLSPDNAGIPLGTGFFYSITTGAADLDNTAGAANDVIGTFLYI